PARLVLADTDLLETLPVEELRNGLAEAIKHGVIGDPGLFDLCIQVWQNDEGGAAGDDRWTNLVRRAVAVKARILLDDPYEQGVREVLNYGHTVGHAVEKASGYRLRHGEAVAVGMCAEARLAEARSIAPPGLAERIEQAIQAVGLPSRIPGWVDRDAMRLGLRVDKKRRAGIARLALPVCIGEVQYGIEVEEEELWTLCLSCMDPI
ncbi:MAG: 3-dehydroquinate synthase, partial [Chloroflexota bacterium]